MKLYIYMYIMYMCVFLLAYGLLMANVNGFVLIIAMHLCQKW